MRCVFPTAGFGEAHISCSNGSEIFKLNRPDGVFTFLSDGGLFMDLAPEDVRRAFRPHYSVGRCR